MPRLTVERLPIGQRIKLKQSSAAQIKRYHWMRYKEYEGTWRVHSFYTRHFPRRMPALVAIREQDGFDIELIDRRLIHFKLAK